MKRILDLFLVLSALLVFLIPFFITCLIIKITDPGPIFHWSKRIGKNNKIFLMPKFRSMKMNTPDVATHLLNNAQDYITPIGKILRKTSLDELPQLYSILKGDMSFVGPRPALFNQDDLISMRTEKGVEKLTPGLTGYAQVNGRDEIALDLKVQYDEYYLKKSIVGTRSQDHSKNVYKRH